MTRMQDNSHLLSYNVKQKSHVHHDYQNTLLHIPDYNQIHQCIGWAQFCTSLYSKDPRPGSRSHFHNY